MVFKQLIIKLLTLYTEVKEYKSLFVQKIEIFVFFQNYHQHVTRF
jgi:hypothetical protein